MGAQDAARGGARAGVVLAQLALLVACGAVALAAYTGESAPEEAFHRFVAAKKNETVNETPASSDGFFTRLPGGKWVWVAILTVVGLLLMIIILLLVKSCMFQSKRKTKKYQPPSKSDYGSGGMRVTDQRRAEVRAKYGIGAPSGSSGRA